MEAFFYPPAKEASNLGISQRLKIYNRGIGTIIKYIFAPMVQEEPLNSEDIALRSGASITLQLDQTIPDEENIRIVTDRGSVFIAQLGYFNISFDPAKLILNPGEEGVSTLRIVSNNYEAEMVMEVISSDISEENYEIIGETEFNLTKNGIHTILINVTAPEEIGTYQLTVKIEETGTGYFKEATLEVEVTEPVASGQLPYFKVIVPESQKHISGKRNKELSVTFMVVGYNDYVGWIWFDEGDPEDILKRETFDPNPVLLTPDNSNITITFTFRIRGNAEPRIYRIWIIGYDLVSPNLRDADYFDLEVTK